ncbi:hypothetical protein E4T48_00065 [Aureobasidium sp. EXF-10727]|nr:hypothetical protein E4T48_00065 [Aureobasidium sp. EXF-10727]KAI4728664.1 hypothetical protein E4T49_03490 [Aureobasidium sp. EXF-10728]
MICNRCLRTAVQRPIALPIRRAITTTTPLRATAAPRSGNPNSSAHTPSAATSTGAAQPFSTPLSASPSAAELQAPSAEKAAPTIKSSVTAGTPLKGLNFVKGKNDPVALEDAEYPSWLWGILKKKGGESAADAGSVEGDLFSKSKKQRRVAAKALRKQQLLNPEALAPKIPLHEQTIDLPAGDGSLQGAIDAMEARDALTKSMRKNRRAKIKEANFLKAMG